jgi:DNA repair protein SbcD/Mre11
MGMMRLLHTADWHLGDRLGSRGIDRTEDLRRAVERVARYCDRENIDVLLVAGDLFSDKLGMQKDLSETVRHLGDTLRPFLLRGGTILALTGNHDRDIPAQTLRSTLALAAPEPLDPGTLIAPGRLYLATEPTLVRLAGHGMEAQFVLMPYPTPGRYRVNSNGGSLARTQRNRDLRQAYSDRLHGLLAHPAFRTALPSVLAAHVQVRSATLPSRLFRITEAQDIVFRAEDIPSEFAYVALGHIHQPQRLGGMDHLRYSGSIERLDLGEADDEKSVTLFELDRDGLAGAPRSLPLEATAFYDVRIDDPNEQLPRLRERYPDAGSALVRYRLTWKAGEHDRDAILRELDTVFPRWYDRDVVEAGAEARASHAASLPAAALDPAHLVRHFLERELDGDADRDELLQLAEALLEAGGP